MIWHSIRYFFGIGAILFPVVLGINAYRTGNGREWLLASLGFWIPYGISYCAVLGLYLLGWIK